MRLPDPSPALDKNRAPMGPDISSSTGDGVRRKAPKAVPDSSSVLDKSQSASSVIRIKQLEGQSSLPHPRKERKDRESYRAQESPTCRKFKA